MSDYDKEQKTEMVKQHKRLAMGVPLTGQAMQPTQKGSNNQPKGGLNQKKK